jgi:hypothetical protein
MVLSVQNIPTKSTNGAIKVGVQDGPGQNPGDPSFCHSGTGVSRPDPVRSGALESCYGNRVMMSRTKDSERA